MSKLPIWFLRVSETHQITPHMIRVVLTGDDLQGLSLSEPDQQVKLYFPRAGQARPSLPAATADTDVMSWYQAYSAIPDDERPWMRSYTIRWHDAATSSIAIDFVVHKHAGPATQWAVNAKPGDTLGVFGPSAMFARHTPLSAQLNDADWVLLIGDDAAIPAMSTIIERLPADKPAYAFIEVAGAPDEQPLTTRARLETTWLHRGSIEPGHSDALLQAVRAVNLPDGTGFAWVGGEANAVRGIRRHLVGDRGMPKRLVDFTGYWRLQLTQDDAPTPEDLAEAQERLAEMQSAKA
ncbi:siderophore-interacting protein [Micromonospora sp. WMMD735]|uniref:siderophore-interacting protein n=1 Tax=Micromonospora sp. WMMD735 TaxID=3404130 RepID=UPI003B940EFE